MKTTAEKLGLNDFDFQMMIFGFYERWCESVSMNSRDYQSILANRSINLWFLTELSKLESEFHELTDRYEGLTVMDYQRCYNDVTYRLFSLRPMPLLEAVKVSTTKQTGIQVFNHLNSN